MTRTIELLCLANSEKERNRCIAGLDLETGDWVRPVSDTEDGGLHRKHYLTKEGYEPKPLDIIEVPLAEPDPEPHQPENKRIESECWKKCGSEIGDREARALLNAVQNDSKLFSNKKRSITFPDDGELDLSHSLTLVRPKNPQFRIRERDNSLRANFELNGTKYDLPITDPVWKRKIRSKEILPEMDLHYEPATAYTDENKRPLFTISLSKPYEGTCYKLVAGIIPVPSAVIDYIDGQ